MAREAYQSLYGDLTKLKAQSLVRDSGTGDDDELFELLSLSTRVVEGFCNRTFAPITATRYFSGAGLTKLLTPDLIAVTTLKADDDDDLTFEVTWATTDYYKMPFNAEPTTAWGVPYTSLAVRTNGTKSTFNAGQRNYEIVGQWGYRNISEGAGIAAQAQALGANVLTMDPGGGAKVAVGMTIFMESEQELITDINTDVLTVTRGLNGTTAVAHAGAITPQILRFPNPVERAALLMAARTFRAAPGLATKFNNIELTEDIRTLLGPLRRLPV